MSYSFLPPAEADIEQIFRQGYLRHGLERTDLFITSLLATVETISDFPKMGKSAEMFGSGSRAFPHAPYIILYRQSEDEIIIQRVLDARSDLWQDLLSSG